jgi:ferritin-like metal-binding protein YciE
MESKTKKPAEVTAASAVDSSMGKLFTDQLKNILWSERALGKILPKMARSAGSPNLISILKNYDTLGQERVKRLEEVSESIGIGGRGKKCGAMEILIRECGNILEHTRPGPVRDAAMIASWQKILHYKIPAYSTIIAYCELSRKDPISEILTFTLRQDKHTDAVLSDAAFNTINFDAAIDENKVLASHYNNRIDL